MKNSNTEASLKHKTIVGVLWSSVERFSVQGVQFLVTLVIARILTPKDFGLVGMLSIFLAIAQTLIDSGFSQALIRKQDRNEIDKCTVFYFNIVISAAIYFLFFLVAPLVADFYNEPQLVILMRVLCLVVVINSFSLVQRSLYTASLDFRTQFQASFISVAFSGVVGVYLALKGYGVWALVAQSLVGAFVGLLLLWYYSSWYPKWLFSWKSFNEMFSFGSKLLLSSIIATIYDNLYLLVIGKVFNSSSLGQFTQADRFTKLPSANISNIIQRVTYPLLCTMQDNDERLCHNYRILIRISAFIVFPLMCLLAAVSLPLVVLLVGEKWSVAATLIVPLSFAMMFYPIHAINLNLLQVKGRSDYFLRIEILKKIVGVIILIATTPFGLIPMCYGLLLSSFISLYFNTYYTNKLVGISFLQQIKDVLPDFVLSLTMFFIVTFVISQVSGAFFQLLLGVLMASCFYLGICVCFRHNDLKVFRGIIMNKR